MAMALDAAVNSSASCLRLCARCKHNLIQADHFALH